MFFIFKSTHFQIIFLFSVELDLSPDSYRDCWYDTHLISCFLLPESRLSRLFSIFYFLFSIFLIYRQVEWISMIIEICIETSFLITSRYYFISAIATKKSLEVTVEFKVEKLKVKSYFFLSTSSHQHIFKFSCF